MLWKEFDNGNASAMAPISDWSSMNRTDHFVQFYEADEFLVNSVAEYLFHGLGSNSKCICIATADHNEMILDRLTKFGIETEKAIESGSMIVLDAEKMLAKFMKRGAPDAKLFDSTVGTLVRETAAKGSVVRAFGEMVAVLWDDGQHQAAVKLESIWNDLRDECDFSLFCAYPLKGFAKAGLNGELHDVCDKHTKTIPAESYSSLTTPEERLRAIAYLQQRAEQLKAEIAELESRISNRLSVA